MKKDEFKDVSILLEGVDENKISSLLKNYTDLNNISQQIEQLKEMRKNQIKAYLKERQWDRFVDDDTKISVTISKLQKEIIDRTQLEYMLTPAQMAQVIHTTTYERVSIMTPEKRKELSKIVRNKTK